jgi:hypothetical protein
LIESASNSAVTLIQHELFVSNLDNLSVNSPAVARTRLSAGLKGTLLPLFEHSEIWMALGRRLTIA